MQIRRMTRPARILVVDDDKLVLGAVTRVLGVDHELVLAEDGIKALVLLGSDARYDVVLCDLVMPQVGGAMIYEEVAMLRPELARRFVFMHCEAASDYDRRLLEVVDRPALRKPFTPAELRQAVDPLLARSRAQLRS